jgi:AraC-like DNA-binding protein
MGPGETMLVVIPHRHVYWIEDGERWEFFWIAFTGQEALRLLRAILAVAGPAFRLRSETIERLAAMSLDLRDGKAESPGAASAIAYAATMALYDDLLGDGGGRAERSVAIGRVLTHIRLNLGEPLDVPSLADLAGLSRAHFTRVFIDCEGVSPASFVLAERMRRAASLLVSGAASVKEVSRACGFDDPNYFAKAFRRSFGASPTEFRTTGMYAERAAGRS